MFITALVAVIAADPPVVTIDRDNVQINESCVVEIRADLIQDEDNNGVIHVVADGITIEFSDEHRELIAVGKGTPWDTLTGIGIRIDGHRNVTIRNAHVHRYKVGIYATNAAGLVLENCDLADGYQHRLKSTPSAEDGSDWLWPHRNDNNQWMTNYGAGIYVEDSDGITIRNCFARRRQNGIILDRVNDSAVYDNDCSFISGWGLAMWRSSGNVVSRNAFDFCVRGYSHGVYNRGQDSAGLLMFEQCSDNIIVERFGLTFDLKILDFFQWQTPKRDGYQHDLCEIVRMFYDALGGARFYAKQPSVVKEIVLGLKRSLILKRYPTATHLRQHLETVRWQ